MAVLQKMLGYWGINPKRVRLDWVSAAEGERFAHVVTEFTEEVRKLGPFSKEMNS
jgi:F420-non-reducing hydrogenase iron-sulfur subunit